MLQQRVQQFFFTAVRRSSQGGWCSSFLFFSNRFGRAQAIEQCQHRTAVAFANLKGKKAEEFDFCFSSFVPTLRFLASDPADVVREKSVLCCLTLGRILKDVVHPGSSGEEENSGEESTLTERRPPPRRVKVSLSLLSRFNSDLLFLACVFFNVCTKHALMQAFF